MKIELTGFKVSVENKNIPIDNLISKKYKILKEDINEFYVKKESIDARNKQNIVLNYNLIIDVSNKVYNRLIKIKGFKPYVDNTPSLEYRKWTQNYRPIIVGFGPAGMYAALYLTRCGANPIIIERGSKVEDRINDVNNFLRDKKLNINSNIQFGEGGAGTFSDGKLTTNANDPLISFILSEFVRYGAPKEIMYKSMPHIGTDYLRLVVKNMRNDLISNGAEFYFNTCFNNFSENDDYITVYTDKGHKFDTRHLILGLGHSARDTIEMLYNKKINIEAKSFSMGVRIEHTQKYINHIQYGEFADALPPASYKMAVHLKDRSVYTFCMCPGGEVMASTSEDGSIVTNGMSYFDRSNTNANAALLVNVNPDDYFINSPLDGLRYQEKYEKLAFELSSDYKAPVNLVKEFLENKVATGPRSVIPSYPHGVLFTDLSKCLPDYVFNSLRESLPLFNKKMKGFACDDAVLTGIESRSSSPVRIIRDENKKSSNKYIYPIGEGAGYAGGITTAALDGLKTAIAISNE